MVLHSMLNYQQSVNKGIGPSPRSVIGGWCLIVGKILSAIENIDLSITHRYYVFILDHLRSDLRSLTTLVMSLLISFMVWVESKPYWLDAPWAYSES